MLCLGVEHLHLPESLLSELQSKKQALVTESAREVKTSQRESVCASDN